MKSVPRQTTSRARRPRTIRIAAITTLAVAVVAVWIGSNVLLRRTTRAEALELFANEQFAAAKPLLAAALEDNPHDVELVRAMAITQRLTAKLLSDAVPYVSRWCEVEPANPEPFRLRLDLYIRLKDRQKALNDAKRLLELDPDNGNLRERVAGLHFLVGELDEAEAQCLRCLEKRKTPSLRLLLARIYDAADEDEQADRVLAELLSDFPNNAEAALLRGKRYVESERYEEAIPILRLLTQVTTGKVPLTARYHLSLALARTGKTEDSAKVFSELQEYRTADRLELDSDQQPGNLALRLKAARARFDLGQRELAGKLLMDVLRRDPEHSEANALLNEMRNSP